MSRFDFYMSNKDNFLELLFIVREKAMYHGLCSAGPCSEGKMSKEQFIKRITNWLNEDMEDN